MFVPNLVKKASINRLGSSMGSASLDSEEIDLTSMTKKKLVDFAKSIDIDVDTKLKKDDLIKAVESDRKFKRYRRNKAYINGIFG